tara:strand:- start:94 stop:336 length:243 start_codon:yes stop_codon:yes gene_type:complete
MEGFLMTRRQVLVLALVVEAGMGAAAIGLGVWVGLPDLEWGHGNLAGLGWGMAGALVLLGILMLFQRYPVGAEGRKSGNG